MSTKAIYEGLRGRLNAMSGLPPVAYENQPYTPVTGTLFLRENLLPADIDALTVADGDSMQYNGIYQVTVFAPAGEGAATGRAMAESVALHFKRGTAVPGGRVLSVSIAAAQQDGGWYQIPVSINYRAHFNG